jgi:GntR family transcriptional regulator
MREGIIASKQGRGTFVIRPIVTDRWIKVEASLTKLANFEIDSQCELQNIEEGFKNPNLIPSDGRCAKRYYHIKRVALRNGRPFSVISMYLDEGIYKLDPKGFRTKTVFSLKT